MNVRKGELSYPTLPPTLLDTGMMNKNSHWDACLFIYLGVGGRSFGESNTCEAFKNNYFLITVRLKKVNQHHLYLLVHNSAAA